MLYYRNLAEFAEAMRKKGQRYGNNEYYPDSDYLPGYKVWKHAFYSFSRLKKHKDDLRK